MCRRRQRGFTLLELLVTLLVIVLATSLVTLRVGTGNRDREIETAVRDLAESANYALDEAQFTGMDYGLLLSTNIEHGEDRYAWEWLELGPNGWRRPESGKEVFAEQQMPEGVELQLELEDQTAQPGAPPGSDSGPKPQLPLYASGETLPGALEVRSMESGELLWRIEWGYLGDFRALQRGLPEEEEQP